MPTLGVCDACYMNSLPLMLIYRRAIGAVQRYALLGMMCCIYCMVISGVCCMNMYSMIVSYTKI